MLQQLEKSNNDDLRSMDEAKRKQLHDQLQNVQEKCLNILDQSCIVISKLKEKEEGTSSFNFIFHN